MGRGRQGISELVEIFVRFDLILICVGEGKKSFDFVQFLVRLNRFDLVNAGHGF